MSVPREPNLDSNKGSYAVSFDHNTNRSSIMGRPNTDDDEERTLPVTQPNGGVQQNMDRFRDYVGRSCCSCVERMPAIVLVIAICLVVALLLALIPAVFVLTNAVAGESQAQVSTGIQKPILRSGYIVPAVDDDLDEPEDLGADTMHGIPLASLLPPNVTICQGFGFTCTSEPHIVISTSRRCDGVSDCPDGSDELTCMECQTAFSCSLRPDKTAGNLICLRPVHLCDGVKQCPDGSDEETHCHSTCSSDELQCKSLSGKNEVCLPSVAICDGVQDCAEGVDEKHCKNCTRGAKMCAATGQCIEARSVCDGIRQCPDGSDEENCDCRSCSGSAKALCDDGTCLERDRICDGNEDANGGLDEQNCAGRCSSDEEKPESVVCSDGRSYLRSEACSGLFEMCDGYCDECDSRHAFTCADKSCIAKMHVCDGVPNCADGEDEQDCDCEGSGDSDEFKCLTSKKCIDQDQRCDGVWDCEDGSDEKQCDECPFESIRCEMSKSCHPASARCDGVPDCPDGTDETDCTCHECTALHSGTYMCESSGRCFRREEVCSPYSVCPNATHADKVFCAGRALIAMKPTH